MATGRISRTEIQKRHQARHKEKGLCLRCSQKAVEGQVLCEFHREANKKYNKKTRNNGK